MIVSERLREFFKGIWETPGWEFRPPKTLDEFSELARLNVEAIGTLFRISDYEAPYIGGPVQIKAIVPPPGARIT